VDFSGAADFAGATCFSGATAAGAAAFADSRLDEPAAEGAAGAGTDDCAGAVAESAADVLGAASAIGDSSDAGLRSSSVSAAVIWFSKEGSVNWRVT
jgi:hypothetical protein